MFCKKKLLSIKFTRDLTFTFVLITWRVLSSSSSVSDFSCLLTLNFAFSTFPGNFRFKVGVLRFSSISSVLFLVELSTNVLVIDSSLVLCLHQLHTSFHHLVYIFLVFIIIVFLISIFQNGERSNSFNSLAISFQIPDYFLF